jgi:hypothetical protein
MKYLFILFFFVISNCLVFFKHIYKSHLNQEKFSMSNYVRDLTRVVLLSSDALQTDSQCIQLLQKVKIINRIFS